MEEEVYPFPGEVFGCTIYLLHVLPFFQCVNNSIRKEMISTLWYSDPMVSTICFSIYTAVLMTMTTSSCSALLWIYNCDSSYVYFSYSGCWYDYYYSTPYDWTGTDVYVCGNLKNCLLRLGGSGKVTISSSAYLYGGTRITMYGNNHTFQFDGQWSGNSALLLTGTFFSVSRPAGVASMSSDSSLVLYSNVAITNINIVMPSGSLQLGSGSTILGGSIAIASLGSIAVTDSPPGPLFQNTSIAFINGSGGPASVLIGRSVGSSSVALQGVLASLTVSASGFPFISFSGFSCSLCSLSFVGVATFTASGSSMLRSSNVAVRGGTACEITDSRNCYAAQPASRYFVLRGVVMEGSLVVFSAAPFVSLENISVANGTVAVDDSSNLQSPYLRSLRLLSVDVVEGGSLSVSSAGGGLQLTYCGVSFHVRSPSPSGLSVLPSLAITNIGASFLAAYDLLGLVALNSSQVVLNYSDTRMGYVADVNDTTIAAYLPSPSVLRLFAAVSVAVPSQATLHMTATYLGNDIRWVFVVSNVVLEDSFQMLRAAVSFVVAGTFSSSSLVSIRNGSTLAVISDGVSGNGCVSAVLRGSFDNSSIVIANNAFSIISLGAIDLRNATVSVLLEPTWNSRGAVCGTSYNKLVVDDTARVSGGGLFSYRCSGCTAPLFYPSLAPCPAANGLQRLLAVDSSSASIVNILLNYSNASSFVAMGSCGWTSVAMTLYSSINIVSPFATAPWPTSALTISNPLYYVSLSFMSSPLWGAMSIIASQLYIYGTISGVNLTASSGNLFYFGRSTTAVGSNLVAVSFLQGAAFTASIVGTVGGNTTMTLSNADATARGSLTLDYLVLTDNASITAYQITYVSAYPFYFQGRSSLNINTTGSFYWYYSSYSYCPSLSSTDISLSVWSLGSAYSVISMISYCSARFGSLDLNIPDCLSSYLSAYNAYNTLSIRNAGCAVYVGTSSTTLTSLRIIGASYVSLEGSFQRSVNISIDSPPSAGSIFYVGGATSYSLSLLAGSSLKISGFKTTILYRSVYLTGTEMTMSADMLYFGSYSTSYQINLGGGSSLRYLADTTVSQSCYSSSYYCYVFSLGIMKTVVISMRDMAVLWSVFRPSNITAESLRLVAVLPYAVAVVFTPLVLPLTVLQVTVPSLNFSVDLSGTASPLAAGSMVSFQSLTSLSIGGRIVDLPGGATFAIQDCATTAVSIATVLTVRAGSSFTVANSGGIAAVSTFLQTAVLQPFGSMVLSQATMVVPSVTVPSVPTNSSLSVGCLSSAFTIIGGLNQNASLVITSAASVFVGPGVFSPLSSLCITAATVSFGSGVIFNASRVTLNISNTFAPSGLLSSARFLASAVDVTVRGAGTVNILGAQFSESNVALRAPDGLTALSVDSVANRSNVSILRASSVTLSGTVANSSQLLVSSGVVTVAAAFKCTANSSVILASQVTSVSFANGETFVGTGGYLRVSAPLSSVVSASRFTVESGGMLVMALNNNGVVVPGVQMTVNVSGGGVVALQTALPATTLTILGVTQSSQVTGSVAGSVVFGSATAGATISGASLVALDVASLCSAASPSRPLSVGAQSSLTVRLAGTQPSYSGFTALLGAAVVTDGSSVTATIVQRNVIRSESLTVTGTSLQSGSLQLDIPDGIPLTVVSIGSLVKVAASIGTATVTLDGAIRGTVTCSSCGGVLSGATLSAVNATLSLSLPTVSAAYTAYTTLRTRTSGSGSYLHLQSSAQCTGSGPSRTCPVSFAIAAAALQGGALVFSFPAMNSTAIRIAFPLLQTSLVLDAPYSPVVLEGDLDNDATLTFSSLRVDGVVGLGLSSGSSLNGSVPCLSNALLLVNGSTTIAAGASLTVNAFSSSLCPVCAASVATLSLSLLSVSTKSSLDTIQIDCNGFMEGGRLLVATLGTVSLLSSVENMTEVRIDAARVAINSVSLIRNVQMMRLSSSSAADWASLFSDNATLRTTAVTNSTIELQATSFSNLLSAKSLSFGGDPLLQLGVNPLDAVNLSISFPPSIALYSPDAPLHFLIAGNLVNFHLTLNIPTGVVSTLTMPAAYSMRHSSISAPVEGALRVSTASILGSVSFSSLPKLVAFSALSQDVSVMVSPVEYLSSGALLVDCDGDSTIVNGGSVVVTLGGALDTTTILVSILSTCSVQFSLNVELSTQLRGSQLIIAPPAGRYTPKVSIVVGGALTNSSIVYNESAGSCGLHQRSDGVVGLVEGTRLEGASSITLSGIQRTYQVNASSVALLKLIQLDVAHCSSSSVVSFGNARIAAEIVNSARRQVVVVSLANHSILNVFNVSLTVTLPAASIDPTFVAVTGISIASPTALHDVNVSFSLSRISVLLQASSFPSLSVASGRFTALSLLGPGARSANVLTNVTLDIISLQTLSPSMDAAIGAVTVSAAPLLRLVLSNSTWNVTNVTSFVGVNISNSMLRTLPFTNESFVVVTVTNNTVNSSATNNSTNVASAGSNATNATSVNTTSNNSTYSTTVRNETLFRMVPHAAVDLRQVFVVASTLLYENWILVLEQTTVDDAVANDSSVAVANSNITAMATPPSLAAWQRYVPLRWSQPWISTTDVTSIPVSAIIALLSDEIATNISVLLPSTAVVASSLPGNVSSSPLSIVLRFVVVFAASSFESVTMRGCVATAGSYIVQLGPGATVRTLLLDGAVASITQAPRQRDGGIVLLSPDGTSSIAQQFVVTSSTLIAPSLVNTTSATKMTLPITFEVTSTKVSGVAALVEALSVRTIAVPFTAVILNSAFACAGTEAAPTMFALPALDSSSRTVSVQIDNSFFSGCKYMSRLPRAASGTSALASFTLRCVPWNGQRSYINTAMRGALFIGDAGVNVFGKTGNISCVTASAEPTTTTTTSRSATSDVTVTMSVSQSVSLSMTMSTSMTDSSSCTTSASNSLTQSSSNSLTLSRTLSSSISVTASSSSSQTQTRSLSSTFSFSMTASTSRSPSQSDSRSESASLTSSVTGSTTITRSSSTTASLSVTPSRSLTVSIDPCNTTFRDDQSSFIRRMQVLSPAGVGAINETNAVFFVLDRVQFASSQYIQVQVGFNTYLRNFYYNTSFDWFPLPKVTDNCIASGFQLVNATDFVVTLGYDDTVSLRMRKDSAYYCNITFSTDIFQCQLITNQTFNFSFAVLVTGTPENVGVLAKLAVRIGSVVSNIAQGPAVLQQSRVGVLMTLADCQFSLVDDLEITDSPLQLGFGSDEGYFLRGAVVGNIAFVSIVAAAVFVALVVIAFLTAAKSDEELAARRQLAAEGRLAKCLSALPFRERLRGLMSVTGFPGILIVPLCITIDSTTSSSVTIIVHSTDPNDSAIGGVGLAFVSVVLIATGVVAIKLDGFLERRRVFRATRLSMCHPLASQKVQPEQEGQRASMWETMRKALRYVFVPVGKMSSIAVRPATLPKAEHQCAMNMDNTLADSEAQMVEMSVPLNEDDPLELLDEGAEPKGEKPASSNHDAEDDDDDEEGAEASLGLLTVAGVSKSVYRMMAPVLDNRVALFVLADMCVAVVNAALVGVGISDRDLCYKLATGSVASYFLYFTAYVIVRPAISRLLFVTNTILALLNFVAATLLLVSMKAADPFYGVASQKVSFAANILSMLQIIPTVFAAVCLAREVRIIVNGKRVEFERAEDMGNGPTACDGDSRNDIETPHPHDESADGPSAVDIAFQELTFDQLLSKAEELAKRRDKALSRNGDGSSDEDDLDVFALLESRFEVNNDEMFDFSIGEGSIDLTALLTGEMRESMSNPTSVRVRRRSISFSEELARNKSMRKRSASHAVDSLNDILGRAE